MKKILEKTLNTHRDVYICLTDYGKAFDRVHYSDMMECLVIIVIGGKDQVLYLKPTCAGNQRLAQVSDIHCSIVTQMQRGIGQ